MSSGEREEESLELDWILGLTPTDLDIDIEEYRHVKFAVEGSHNSSSEQRLSAKKTRNLRPCPLNKYNDKSN